MKKVIATADGFFGRRIVPGETFEVPDNTKRATWFMDAGKADRQAPKPQNPPQGQGQGQDAGLV